MNKWSKKKRTPLHEAWKAMEGLMSKGLVKSIGVANYSAVGQRGDEKYWLFKSQL